jgi:hypothetical protein
MEIVDPGRFESKALEWLLVETKHLLEELRKGGVTDEACRTIAGNFLFGLTCRLDGSEGAGEVALCFVDGDDLIRSGDEVDLHDYVLGTVDEVVDG